MKQPDGIKISCVVIMDYTFCIWNWVSVAVRRLL